MKRAPSIRTIVALLMAAPVVAIAAVLVTLSSVTAHRVAEDLGRQLMERANGTAQNNVRQYLTSAVRISDLYALRIERGELPTSGLTAWEPTMLDDLLTAPDVASICFGNDSGDSTWLLRHAGRLEVGRADGPRESFTQEFIVNTSTGALDLDHPIRTYQYDPRKRPWYAAALASDTPVWTPIYFWFGDAGADLETGTGYARTIADPGTHTVRGVLVIDVTLGALSGFLKRLPLAQQGSIFITDETNHLVASSHGLVNSPDGKRLTLAEHEHPAARAAAVAMSQQTDHGAMALCERVRIADEPSRLQVTAFEPQPGLRWSIITAIPERVFLADADRVQRHSILLGLLAVIVAVGLGLLLSRSICKPILELRAHARCVGAGDFESRLHLTKARELQDLSTDLNEMAIGLKERMELRHALMLANEVQQSLLPQAPPRVTGLDIVGHSRYCQTTGGDYYDFIDFAELPLKMTLVAVGDVMGHGLASALLMATARAALRATALKEGSLGMLLTRVNAVLARDARHNRFMTMALAVVDPSAGTMRWASAGHDSPFIYSPVRGEFREVSGGDIPLGIADGVQYEEYLVEDVEPGSIIVIGTDGIWEANSLQGEIFGKDRLCSIIRTHSHETAAGIGQAINEALAAHCGGEHYRDDVTFIALKLWLGR